MNHFFYLLLAIFLIYPQKVVAKESFFDHATDLYVGGHNGLMAAKNSLDQDFIFHSKEVGFDHDIALSGIILSGFYRESMIIAADGFNGIGHNGDLGMRGGGASLGYRTKNFKFSYGYSLLGSKPSSLSNERPEKIKLYERFGQISYYLMDYQYFSLQLDLTGSTQKVYRESYDPWQGSSASLGLSTHFGKFKGGEYAAITMATIAMIAIIANLDGNIHGLSWDGGSSCKKKEKKEKEKC